MTRSTKYWPLLVALSLAAGCDSDSPSDPNAPGVLSIALSAPAAPADGAAVVVITGSVDPDTRGDRRNLTFTTTAGAFTEGDGKTVTVVADENGTARVALRAPAEPGWARIRVSTGTILRQDSVQFTRALPERIDVEPEKFALSAGIKNEMRISAQLRRSSGRVSPLPGGVTFRAYQGQSNVEIGVFGVPGAADANGVVSARYTAGNTDYRGPARIVAMYTGEGAAPVSGEATIQIID